MISSIHIPPLGRIPENTIELADASKATGTTDWAGLLFQAAAGVVFVLYMLTFLRLWPWGAARFDAPLGVGARTPLIQYGAYAGVVWLTVLAVMRTSLGAFLRPSLPYVPFLIVGLASGIAAAGKADFVRPIVFWLVGVSGLTAIARLLGARWLYHALAGVILLSLGLTVLLCTAFPAANSYPDPRAIGGISWAGLFWEKNSLGLAAAQGVLLAIWWRGVPKWLPGLLLGLSLFCLARSGSGGASTAIVGSLAATAIAWVVNRQPMSPMARGALFASTIAITITAVLLLLPVLLAAFGRDPTLTGRTDIWPAFLARALEKPILGWGPGTFTFPSYAIADLVRRFVSFGNISSPHNLFIAVLGDSGILGFMAFVLPLVYLTLIVPFRIGGPTGLLSLAVGTLICLHGFAESAVIFGFSMNWMMLFVVLVMLDEKPARVTMPSSYVVGDEFRGLSRAMPRDSNHRPMTVLGGQPQRE